LVPLASTSALAISAEARELHLRSTVVDTHADTTQRLVSDSFDLGARQTDGSVDIPRMREGGVGALFFAIWVPGSVRGADAVRRAVEQIQAVRRHAEMHPSDLVLSRTAEDIRRARAAGRIAVLMGIEGGHMINGDLDVLERYAALGARYMTLTHAVNTECADASTDKPVHNGLSSFGAHVVRDMNRLGMAVDVSHVSDKAFDDVLGVSRAPVFASHSSCRALCDSPRNLSDPMIRALAAKGGVMQINFHVGFLSQEFRRAEQTHPELHVEVVAKAKDRCGENEACKILESGKMIREYVAKGRFPRVEWTKIVDHIDHAARIAGVEHVGLGSDFDGACMPYGMEDVSALPQITEALLGRGYSEVDIQKILGGNTLRFLEDVVSAAEQVRGTTV
jgi:membrane dipeptidase